MSSYIIPSASTLHPSEQPKSLISVNYPILRGPQQGFQEAMDHPTNLPPPYSSLGTTQSPTPNIPTESRVDAKDGDEPLIYEQWVYHANPWISIWSRRSRTISTDHVNVSYGISKNHSPLHVEPDMFFTCRFQIRSGDAKDKRKINMLCCIVAALTILHRVAGGRGCDCDWWTLSRSSHGCLVRPRGLLWIKKWWQTRQLRQAVRAHDRLCSCGCFDVAA